MAARPRKPAPIMDKNSLLAAEPRIYAAMAANNDADGWAWLSGTCVEHMQHDDVRRALGIAHDAGRVERRMVKGAMQYRPVAQAAA